MTKKTPEYLNYFLEDCLQGDISFSKKHMFGGYAVYKNGRVFCLFIKDTLYFKVGEDNIEMYKKHGSSPFSYKKKNGTVGVMSYWELPEEILENRDELENWIEQSLRVVSKPKSKKKTKADRVLDEEILKTLLKIDLGKVTTYKVLADKFGVHPRRIASVMKYNNSPEQYPCYKVIAHSGKVGGYSALDGVNSKLGMLLKDGIKIKDGKIGKAYIQFNI